MKAEFTLIGGLELKDPYVQLRASIVRDHLLIEERIFKVFRPVTDKSYRIPMQNIIATISTTESEMVELEKSALGRGVAGGLLFGPAGLLLGGLSGIGKKKKVKHSQLLIISYLSSQGDIENITLDTHKVSNAGITKRFQKYLQKELNRVRPTKEVAEIRRETEKDEVEVKEVIL